MKSTIDCPMCVNSSGYTYYTPHTFFSQKCSDCKGTGKVSKMTYNVLKNLYGDLIK